ncbi:hypothetical protein L6V77_30190 [Myxococcota bacterium]|nr:hypothetical protein [Myxococcota bacterium]
MTEVVVLPMAAEADVERFRGALAALLEERAGDATTHRVVVAAFDAPRETPDADPERVVLVAVEASPEGLRRLWQAGLEHPGAASHARGFVIVRRTPPAFGEPDPALALPATLTRLFNRPRADPAWRLADVSVSDALSAAAGHRDADDRPVYALREADGLDAPTTREAAALEGHYRALVDRLFPAARRRLVVVQTTDAPIERRLLLQITTDEPRPFELGETFGLVVLVAPSGAGKSVFLRRLARQRDLPVLSLSTVSAPEQLFRRLQVARVVDGRLRCAIDAFEASAAWLGHMQQAAFAHELVDALRGIRESRGATGFDVVFALRPSEHVETLATALRALGPVAPVRLAPLDSTQAHDFARTHLGDDAGILLRRLDDVGVTAHREDLRFFSDLCARWRDRPDAFTADPVAVMQFGMDWRLAPADKTSTWSAVDRREMAAAVAFASTLTNRLRVAAPDAPHDPTCLTETELVRLTHQDRRRLWDTLSVDRLFESDAVATSFQHESDREFLAAEHLAALPSHLVEQWLVVGDGDHARVPFSLRAVARWLLLRAPEDRVRWLLEVQPTLVVEALPWLRAELQAPAVEALIHAHRAGRFPIWNAERWLSGPDTVLQAATETLRLLLGDPDRYVRRFAARALRGARGVATHEALLDRALDSAETTDVRVAAASSVRHTGDDGALRRLTPLLELGPEEDPELELRGIAILALWPRHIDAPRLFAALGPWPNAGFFGAYKLVFIARHEVLAGLSMADLDVAIPWAQARLARAEHDAWRAGADDRVVKAFASELFARAFVFRSTASIRRRLVDLFCAVVACHAARELRLSVDEPFRRDVAVAFVGQYPNRRTAFDLATEAVLTSSDLEWLIGQASVDSPTRDVWTELAANLWDPWARPELFDAIRALPDVVRIAPWHFGTLELDSETARDAKHRYDLSRQLASRPEVQRKTPPLEEIVARPGRPGRRWAEAHFSVLCEGDWGIMAGGSVDAFTLSGAPAADAPIVATLLEAAAEFVQIARPDSERWVRDEMTRTDVDYAAMRAFGTLAKWAPDKLLALGSERLGAWAPLAVDLFPSEGRGPWLRLLWREARRSLEAALRQLAATRHGAGAVRRALGELGPGDAPELALEVMDSPSTTDSVRHELLCFLFEAGASETARTWALGHLDREGIEVALVAYDTEAHHVCRLLTEGRGAHAAKLITAAREKFSVRAGQLDGLRRLPPADVGALVDELLSLVGGHDPFGAQLPRALIEGLVDAGEVGALTDLASRHPDLQPDAERARVQRAQIDWRPPTLEDLIAGSPRIDTVDGFQRRIVDALEEIQRFDLDGDAAYTEGLWNETNLKQETDLRNWLKAILKRPDRLPRGVDIGGAEAELREGRQRTDLVLQRTEGARKLYVVVEVKRAPDVAPGTLPAKAYKQLADYLDALAGSAEVCGILVVFIANARRREEWLRALTPPDERARAFVFCVPPRPGKRGANA